MWLRPAWFSIVWVTIGLSLLLITTWQHFLARVQSPSASLFVCSQLIAGVLYCIAVFVILRNPATQSPRYILLVGIAARLIMLPTPPLFDNDMYRYLWDGKMMSHGINPFLSAPSAPELAHLRDPNWAQIGYPEIRTIYPPISQFVFGLAYVCGAHTPVLFKTVFLLFDIVNMLLILSILKMVQRPSSWILLHAWSPLAIKEFANSGHLEPVMLCFLLATFYFLLKGKAYSILAGVNLGVALATKFMPALFVPLCWRLGRWRAVCSMAAVSAICYLPFIGAGKRLFSGIHAYAHYWLFNHSIFAVFIWLEKTILPSGWHFSLSLARMSAVLVMSVFTLYSTYRIDVEDKLSVLVAVRNMIAVCLLLSPTADPWYVCWLLPLLCISPSIGLLVFTVTCNLSYLYYLHNTFPVWISLLEYLPVYAIIIGEFIGFYLRNISVQQTPGQAAENRTNPSADRVSS